MHLHRIFSLALAFALLLVPCAVTPASASSKTGSVTADVTGSFTNTGGDFGDFYGSVEITHFDRQGDTLIASGTLSGMLVGRGNNVIGNVRNIVLVHIADITVSLPVTSLAASCDRLHLELAAPDVALPALASQLHVDPIALDISATAGESNLSGNVRCAVAGLLSHRAPASGLAALLNRLLAALS